jgi:hypothetical protein
LPDVVCREMWHVGRVTGFSRRPQDVGTARQFLVEAASRAEGELPTYGEVAATYGGIPRGAGPVLNSIGRECGIAGEPDLTALVVRRRTRLPGTFKGKPVEAGTSTEKGWRAELHKIRRHNWNSRSA